MEMLRIDWNILFTIINLLILVAALRIFLFKPVQKIIAERQKEADAAFDEAEKVKQEATEVKAKYEESLAESESEKKKIIAEARKNADAEYQKIIDEANEQARETRRNAIATAEAEKAKILKKADKEIADMVSLAASKMVAESSGADGDSALYDKFLNKAGE